VEGAVAARRKLVAVDPQAKISVLVSSATVPAADVPKLLTRTRAIVELEPQFVEALYQLGVLHFLFEQPRDAYQVYRRGMDAAAGTVNGHALPFRLEAARAAGLVAAGKGKDPAPEDERGQWRQNTLDLLNAELIVCRQRLAAGTAASRSQAAAALGRMMTDPAFAPFRSRTLMRNLPEEEQTAWAQLWSQTQALREQATKLATPKDAR
jgi:hypothetical protein